MNTVVYHKRDYINHPLLSRLQELHSIPKQLHVLGELPSVTLDEKGFLYPRILTIVGSRKCTTYGKNVVRHLLSGFTSDEVIIVSGLALGIDSEAHNVALTNNLITLAVPGSGLSDSVLYPKSNLSLAKTIIEKGGALVSELEDATPSAPWTFPARNRIMAGLSDAVLIIEAEDKSGTLITARQALELGKNIGVVPGDIFSSGSKGVHDLLRDGAAPITSHDDLRELLFLPQKTPSTLTPKDVSLEESTILSLLQEPKDKDALFNESSMSMGDFLTVMTTLEIKGYIEDTFGEIRKIV